MIEQLGQPNGLRLGKPSVHGGDNILLSSGHAGATTLLMCAAMLNADIEIDDCVRHRIVVIPMLPT